MDNFKFYSNLTENPNFTKEENAQICLQAFVHFMKLMDIARTKDEASAASECMHEIDGVNIPFADTLNIQNGLNYAQFLEAILRIAYYKKEHSDQAGNPEGFKITLETMFADAELDLKKRMKSDPILNSIVTLSNQGTFKEYFDILGAVFHEKGMNKGDHLEISKGDFISVLKDANILIIPKVEKAPEEGKGDKGKKPDPKKEEEGKEAPARKFDEMDVKEAITASQSFDDDQLGYIDFLEAIIRIAHVFPFNEEELADMVTFEMKVQYFVQKLDAKYKNLKDIFSTGLTKNTETKDYRPRIVVDEDSASEGDMDYN
jgi:hypothetical protein